MKNSKKIFEYPVIFEPAIEGGYNVSFPNFPGCVTFGNTFEEAQQMAKEALSLWIETLKGENKYQEPLSPIISQVAVEA